MQQWSSLSFLDSSLHVFTYWVLPFQLTVFCEITDFALLDCKQSLSSANFSEKLARWLRRASGEFIHFYSHMGSEEKRTNCSQSHAPTFPANLNFYSYIVILSEEIGRWSIETERKNNATNFPTVFMPIFSSSFKEQFLYFPWQCV